MNCCPFLGRASYLAAQIVPCMPFLARTEGFWYWFHPPSHFKMFQLGNKVRFCQAQSRGITLVLAASYVDQDTCVTTCRRCVCIVKLSLKMADLPIFVEQIGKQKRKWHKLGPTGLEDTTLLKYIFEHTKLLSMAAKSSLKDPSMPSLFPAQHSSRLGNQLLSWYNGLPSIPNW